MPSTAPRRRPTTSGPTSAPGGSPEEVPFSFGHQDSWKQLPLLGRQLIGGLPRRAARLSSIDVLCPRYYEGRRFRRPGRPREEVAHRHAPQRIPPPALRVHTDVDGDRPVPAAQRAQSSQDLLAALDWKVRVA